MKDYKKAFSIAEAWYKNTAVDGGTKRVLERIFPELKEDMDEEIRKDLICFLSTKVAQCETRDKYIVWLELQKERCPKHNDAEKEKIEYVYGQNLTCLSSFSGFKKGENYLLEYIENDTYIGRSDNILNQTFYITPKQLYTLFDCEPTGNIKENTTLSPELKEFIRRKVNIGDLVRIYNSSLPITGDYENYRLALVDSYKNGMLQVINIIDQL